MNVLIIGQNLKMAKVFTTLPSKVFILVDKKFKNYRSYDELSDFITIETNLNISSYRSIFSRSLEIKKIVDENDIDLVFTNEKISMIAAFLSFKLLIKKKLILLSTSHNSYAWLNRYKTSTFSKIIGICTHGYISLSSYVTDCLLKNNLTPQRILTTPNPIESGLFEKKENYCFSSEIPSISYVAVQYEGKGQFTLIKAAKILKNKGISIKVSLFGDVIDEEYHKRNLNYIKDCHLENNIQFFGRVDNSALRKLLCTYDIYVCPSEMEMSPFNVLEAKSAGMPIIATKVGGIPDIITHGEDGLLIPAKSEQALADAIELLLNNEEYRKKIGSIAFEKSINIHSPAFIAIRLKSFIEGLNLHYK